jgi:uncharacterized membrane protein YeiH
VSNPWLLAAKVFAIWLAVWFAIGFSIAIVYAQHGSLVFAMYGVFAGAIGGSLHALSVLVRHAISRR